MVDIRVFTVINLTLRPTLAYHRILHIIHWPKVDRSIYYAGLFSGSQFFFKFFFAAPFLSGDTNFF